MKLSLKKQLIIISCFVLFILSISLLFILPKSLEPFFEDTIYDYLNKPLQMYNEKNNYISLNIVFIQKRGNIYSISNNKSELDIDNYSNIFSLINKKQGKFKYNNKYYYYSTSTSNYNNYIDTINIALTDNSFLTNIKKNLTLSLIPLVIITFSFTCFLLIIWSNYIINKTNKLKEKINNINNEKYKYIDDSLITDEFTDLNKSVDNVKDIILKQDKYKSEMYQNVSHDFKTPIAVIKSYIESYHDNITDIDTTLDVINNQTNKLEHQVKTLLDLNKITYLEKTYNNKDTIILDDIVNDYINNYKYINKNIEFIFNTDHSIFDGNNNIWEPIIDNILNNDIRYAKSKIEITIKNNKISFYNDGESIKNISELFNPFIKGNKGKTGLGLTIVKRNCDLINYSINVRNKNGVIFTIKKN